MSSGSILNKAVHHDYVRFWWDMHTDSNVATLTMAEVMDLWGDADPNSWNVNGNGVGSDYPAYELRDGCDGNTYCSVTDWDEEDEYNGVNH